MLNFISIAQQQTTRAQLSCKVISFENATRSAVVECRSVGL